MNKKDMRLMMVIMLVLLLNIIKNWFSADIDILKTLLIDFICLSLSIYILVKLIRSKPKNIFIIILFLASFLINFVPLRDWRVYMQFPRLKEQRLQAVKEYEYINIKEDYAIQFIDLTGKYEKLAQEDIMLIYDNVAFCFPVFVGITIFEGAYIIYSKEPEERVIKLMGRVYSIEEIEENWYYVKL